MQELSNLADESDLVIGSAEIAFHLGFDANLIDDPRLGYISGKVPDVIVVEDRYRFRRGVCEENEPETSGCIADLLEDRYEMVLRNDFYEIYVRKQGND